MRILLTLLPLFIFFNSFSQTLEWSSFTDSTVTYSSPRAADLNNDGVKDIVIGAGKEAQQTNYGVLAIDGATGAALWNVPTPNEIFTSAAFKDITGDNIPDVFLGGRDAQLYAINGANGNIIWEFFPYPALNPADSGLYNFYSVQFVPDMNADLIPDLLVANGGDHAAPVWQTNRPPGHLMVIDAVTGSVLAKAVVPDSAETYCSPIVSDLRGDGTLFVIYGTGGETLGGSMWVCELVNDLMNNDLSASIPLVTNGTRGFIAPASLAKFPGSSSFDIIVQGYNGTIYRFESASFSQLWSTTIAGTESSAAPVIGNFTGTIAPDVFCVLYKGTAPSFTDYYQVMLNGVDGSIVFKDSISQMHFASSAAFDSNGDGRDEVLISVNNHVGHFEHELKLINFQDSTVTIFWNAESGTNIGSTPFVGDLDGDTLMDVVFAFRADSMNPMGWKGMYVKRLGTSMKFPSAGIAWGGYMGTKGDGHYTYTAADCGPGSIIAGFTKTMPWCNGASDGAINLNVSNGKAPLTFLWSNGSVNNPITGIAAGTYSVLVTDSTGCTETTIVNLNNPFNLGMGGVAHNVCEGGTTGQATASSSGCVCMFSGCVFSWSTGTTGYTATGLAAGIYTVTITHGNGCVVTNTVVINDGLAVIDSIAYMNVSCNNLANGSAEVFAVNSSSAEYVWSTGDTASSVTNLAAGAYSVSVSDSRPCYDTMYFTITEPSALSLALSSTPESFGNDGTAAASVGGGIAPYSYLWDDASMQTTSTASGLAGGYYNVIVTDSNGCTITDSVYVDITLTVNEINSEETVSAYPNPAADRIVVKLNGNSQKGCDVVLTDVQGKVVRRIIKTVLSSVVVDVSDLQAGIYFMKVNSGEVSKTIQLFIE